MISNNQSTVRAWAGSGRSSCGPQTGFHCFSLVPSRNLLATNSRLAMVLTNKKKPVLPHRGLSSHPSESTPHPRQNPLPKKWRVLILLLGKVPSNIQQDPCIGTNWGRPTVPLPQSAVSSLAASKAEMWPNPLSFHCEPDGVPRRS